MSNHQKLFVLLILTLATIVLYLTWGLSAQSWQFALKLRSQTMIAIVVAGCAVGISTLVFYTIVNNRIVTPQVLGLDKLYELSKTLVIYLFGSSALLSMHFVLDYALSLFAMLIFAFLLYWFIFKKVAAENIYFLLLVGLICATLFDSMTTFFQVLLDPNEFQVAMHAGFASFNAVKMQLVMLACITILPILYYSIKYHHRLDVMALGREHALNLGLDYDRTSQILLIFVVLALASATALAGPMMFLGLLVLNLTLEIFRTHQHRILLVGIMLVSILSLTIGQFVVMHLLNFKTTLSVIINFIGGIYFFWILLKENRRWQ
ncbi:petrobactin ABC transporter permease YclO [Acinetobacter puyangensis]|uniref:Iron complex transport system permease protein n=1 Tax=Acinetobacter puyangensis TaxID=1096779 RepID=A0A240EDQ2_9GAMM|nr:iron chelate uptake ABC transporter family permease subunit [Acinetobacter puyangensis]SNX46045.1 iron complex transport system permease protein [Acinetobacter puyangensis]